jgi:hypothetical protein
VGRFALRGDHQLFVRHRFNAGPDWRAVSSVAVPSASATDYVSVSGGQLRLGGSMVPVPRFQLIAAPVGAFTLDVAMGAFPGDAAAQPPQLTYAG